MEGQEPDLPVWLVYLGGFIGVAAGAAIYVFGLLKKNFSGGKDEPAGAKDVQVAGALVDNRAVEKLSGEVTGQSLAITAQAVAIKEQTEAIREQTRAIRDLHGDLNEIADISRSITDLGTQIARMK